MPDDMKCPDCVVGDLKEIKMESDSYYFCEACGWSEWDEQNLPASDYLRYRELDELELEPDW